MSTKELQEKIVAIMKQWQKIENASVASTGQIIGQTENPVLRMVMEIIQRDSQNHHRLQRMVIDSLIHEAVSLTPEDMENVWGLIEKHIELEKQTMQMAQEALAALKGKKMVVQEYLINYLIQDEAKHNAMLESLNKVKAGMYPYG